MKKMKWTILSRDSEGRIYNLWFRKGTYEDFGADSSRLADAPGVFVYAVDDDTVASLCEEFCNA